MEYSEPENRLRRHILTLSIKRTIEQPQLRTGAMLVLNTTEYLYKQRHNFFFFFVLNNTNMFYLELTIERATYSLPCEKYSTL